MQSNKEQFKSALNKNFGAMLGGSDSSELMKDVNKFTKEMREGNKIPSKKKKETIEQIIRKKIKNNLKDKIVGKNKMNKPIGKLFQIGKSENNEATGSGSSGGYVGKVAFADSDFVRNSFEETPKLQKEDVDKVESQEATTGVGGYSTPAMWAKSTSKKDWGPSRKTQYKGGSFVKVKKKCTKFPYCNQGDINALKLSKNEAVSEAIKNVSKKYNISERVIKNIIEHELSKLNKK